MKVFLIAVVAVSALGAGRYDFLEPINRRLPRRELEEISPPSFRALAGLDVPLAKFYGEFEKTKIVKAYLAMGAQFYSPSVAQGFLDALKSINDNLKLGLTDFLITDQAISFFDGTRGITYEVTVGHERNDFIDALSEYQVVMYYGHSRHGRGPALDDMTNYFRMGNVFNFLEVDVRNPYFHSEPIINTEQYPTEAVSLEGEEYSFQYRGQKDSSSELPSDSYTKVIPGGDEDLKSAPFSRFKQILFFDSCSNVHYWRDPFRQRFANPQEKLVFGTAVPVGGRVSVDAILLMSLVRQLKTSDGIAAELNETCKDCYLAY